jgi:hypothetical protein
MHRISVFRDDVIFVIYLCQRRMYPVDSSRPAEGYEVDDAEPAPAAAAESGAQEEGSEESSLCDEGG